MSKTIFSYLISLLKYSPILLIIVSLPKVKMDFSEISFTLKCSYDEGGKNWPKIIGDSFNDPSKVTINGVEPEKLNANWYDVRKGENKIVLTYNRIIDSYENMFTGIETVKLEEITSLKFNTEKPKSMKNMFYGTILKKITFEEIDTSLVTDMSHLFENCGQLEEIDISKFNMASVTDINSMFFNCVKLAKIDTRNFETSKVTNISNLFESCESITELDLSNFDTANVVDMNSTFRFCIKIKVIDVRSFDTSKVTNMYDMFAYCYELVYLNVSSFNTQNVKVFQGMFFRLNNIKYLDVSKFNYGTFLTHCGDDYDHKVCRFHLTFAYSANLFCLNFKTIYFENRLYDRTFEAHNGDMKFCADKEKINVDELNWIKQRINCEDQCFKDMSKKFDISRNAYVDTCDSQKFDFNDLCWDNCPYDYYRIFTDRRTCQKEVPGENYYLYADYNIYYKCYSSCKNCDKQGTVTNHNCNECLDGFSFISKENDKYSVENNCYENCENLYYFNEDHEYFCVETCPSGYKLIKEKKKCIDSCTNDNKYKKEYNNECIETCPEGTVDINNKCQPCYETCKSCSEIGTKDNHKCDVYKDNFNKLIKNSNNCYENCADFYFFDDTGYNCKPKDECPDKYKLIDGTNKFIKYCKDDDMFESTFEYNGGCYKSCKDNSYYTIGEQNFCKCEVNTTCKDCTLLAIENNLCSTCNDGYYPKKEEKDAQLKNCYNTDSKPTNYILISEQYYERCYSSCKTCSEIGNEQEHKCTECKDNNYEKLKNNNDNCYEKCAHYYYFNDAGEYICLEHDECPPGYKLIYSTNKCIKYCKDDTKFNSIYEYNGKCYASCPNDNYYTLSDQKICNCMDNNACRDCPSENNPNNLCSICNDGFYPIKDESSNYLKNCYNTAPSSYFLKDNMYEACYESCETCTEKGIEGDHKCITCKTGFNQEGTNCNQNCDNLFYYDDQILKCVDVCPSDYKKIDSSKECIQNCNSRNLKEYNNICYSTCKNGFYNNNGINTCKCMNNIKCKECPISDNYNYDENILCYSCNNEEGYYPKEDEESTEGLMNCYNSETIPKNYYLNQGGDQTQYELCYHTCGSCDEKGDDSGHKCKECLNDNYAKLNNNNNCYEKCAHYYYFNEAGEYICLEHDECPTNPHNYKLITGTNKCIDYCKNDNIFNSKYEFNGKCYTSCPNGFYTDNGQNICKCMNNIACKDCPSENNPDNLCSSCNVEKYYYPKEEDINNNDNTNNLFNCYNISTIDSNYILISGQYKKCYDSCKTCEQIGTINDHKCKDCKDGFTKLNNNNNCYEECSYYFYFDDDNIYHCQNKNECPTNYKLMEGTKRCVINCKDFDKYEYDNICYEECPQYWTDTSNDHKCKLDCATFDLFFNYEQTNCIREDEIPKGYYIKNPDKKFIEKCHENCEECDIGPTTNNNNCKKCPNTGTMYYELGNCKSNCVNGDYIENSIKKCKCSTNISCKSCDENGKCFSCNNDIGYYQIEDDINENNENPTFINCVKDPEGYYLSNNVYKKCYSRCKSCSGEGDNKCTECKSLYEFHNDFPNDNKCYDKCTYNYYYDTDNNIICTIDTACPNNMKIIEQKKRCIDNCKNDNKYKFEYDGKCYEHCPQNTKNSLTDNNICIEENQGSNQNEECNLKINEFDLLNDTLTVDNLNNFTTIYASKYGESGNYVTKLENDYFKIFIYNNIICLQKVSQDAKLVDFGDSFLSLLGNYQLSEPIVTIITDKKSNESSYALAHPTTGALLNDLNNDLRDTKILELEDIYSLLPYYDEKRKEYIIDMLTTEKTDLFNLSNDFYSNLCFYYDSPNDKDIPMKDRPYFYANINRCESRCNYQGIDYSLAKFKCQCTFQAFSDSTTLDNTPSNTEGQSYNTYPEKKSSTNIEVFKCMKDVFKSEYFKGCAGGIIMLILSAGQIACMTLYFLKWTSSLKKHVFSLFQSFKKYQNTNMKIEANPPKKSISNKINTNNNKEIGSSKLNLKKDIILVNTMNKKTEKKIEDKKEERKLSFKVKEINDNEENKINKITTEEKLDEPDLNETIGNIENEDLYMKMINEYVNPDFDENDFDEVLAKDKRSFLQFFTERAFKNQIFINTIYIKHIFKPFPLKIMLLILYIELYFVISALFYSENYLSKRFYSDEKEFFLSFVPKRIDEIIFTMIICGLIQYFCSYIFDFDEHLKRIFTNKIKIELDSALTEFNKKLKRNFIILISISIVVTIFSFFYISSFNVVYPYIKNEWITCSFFILILMQIANLVSTLLGTCCRYLSIRWYNVKLFRLSLNLD